jgi:hypothetical protein
LRGGGGRPAWGTVGRQGRIGRHIQVFGPLIGGCELCLSHVGGCESREAVNIVAEMRHIITKHSLGWSTFSCDFMRTDL